MGTSQSGRSLCSPFRVDPAKFCSNEGNIIFREDATVPRSSTGSNAPCSDDVLDAMDSFPESSGNRSDGRHNRYRVSHDSNSNQREAEAHPSRCAVHRIRQRPSKKQWVRRVRFRRKGIGWTCFCWVCSGRLPPYVYRGAVPGGRLGTADLLGFLRILVRGQVDGQITDKC